MQGPFRPTSFRWVEGVTESTIRPITKLGHYEQILSSSTKFRYFEIQKASLTSKHFPNTNYEKIQNLPVVEIAKKNLWHMRYSPHPTGDLLDFWNQQKSLLNQGNLVPLQLFQNIWPQIKQVIKPTCLFRSRSSTKQIAWRCLNPPCYYRAGIIGL